jgi:hypothetical protein
MSVEWLCAIHLCGAHTQHFGWWRISLQGSDKYGQLGTTFDASFAGIPFLKLCNVDKIKAVDKAKIFPAKAGMEASPKGWTSGGVPVFWQESKSMELWEACLSNWSVTSVVDLTPGSGQLATACMGKSIPYWGLTRNELHASWLANVLDRWALHFTVLAKADSLLYHVDIATSTKELFADILDELQAPDEEEKEDEDELDGIC